MYIHSEITAGTLSDNPFPFCSCEHCLPLQGETEKMIVGDGTTEAELVAMQQTIEEQHQQQQQQQVSSLDYTVYQNYVKAIHKLSPITEHKQ